MSDEAWSSSSNEALFVSLVAPSADGSIKTLSKFHPKFTYPIFGESEEIFGYKDLTINLLYNASDMRPNLSVTYKKKFTAVGDTEATDINATLAEFLPEVAFQKKKEFETAIHNVRADWTPPGELLNTFTAKGQTFEVWKGNLADPAVKQLVNRIQILVPLFIEGGSEISTDEADSDRWTVFFLYQKKTSTADPSRFEYVFAGYTTVYRFFFFQSPPTPPASPSAQALESLVLGKNDFDLSTLPCRSRISQYLIIPTFQGRSLGPKLYSLIYAYYLTHPSTAELTVEDPNEAFDDMRDVADLIYLRTVPEFNALSINTSVKIPKSGKAPDNIVDPAAWEAVRRKTKIAPRQFARVLEMNLMQKLPYSVRPDIDVPENEDEEGGEEDAEPSYSKKEKAPGTKEEEHEYQLWRLLLKKRLYKHNRDALSQLEIPERIEKLEDTVSSVEFDYVRLVAKADDQAKRLQEISDDDAAAKSNGKRKVDEVGDAESPASKKAKVSTD
ncbi:acyl-CoA N-acyltransferase [Podospora australis]|uniref:Histone acetyltransferase type B catalytic subunit n=1 Tax=Podospora australis TaxID=1536484 RepID=A0AAN7ANS8_9PEZI|nr:acyl-CoA N-acyltransferase [Podospora australis]